MYLVLSRHRTTLYARIVVPAELRAVVGKWEIRKSLGTIDRRLGLVRAAPWVYAMTGTVQGYEEE